MEEVENTQLLFPFTSLFSIDKVETKWRNRIHEIENDVIQARSEYIISPGSAEYNDRIRVINLRKLLEEHLYDNDYKPQLSEEKINYFLRQFSLEVNAMNVTKRALRQRLISNLNSDYMENLWLHLSYLYYPLINQKFGTEYGRLLKAAIKNLLLSFPQFLENIINQEISCDKIIHYSSGYDKDDLEAKITRKRIRPYNSFLTKDEQEKSDEPENKVSLLSPDEKATLPKFYYVDAEEFEECIENQVKNVLMDVTTWMNNLGIYENANMDKIKSDIESSVKQQIISIYQDDIEIRDSSAASKIIKKNVKKNSNKSDEAGKNLKELVRTDLPNTDADLYIGFLYEHDCFEFVYKALSTIKKPPNNNMEGSIFIQTIILLGEAVKYAHGIRTDLNSDNTIVGTLIFLRNNLSHYVSWADLHNISNWDEIFEELTILKEKIQERLKSLEDCFKEENPPNLSDYVKNLKDQGMEFLYTPPQGLHRNIRMSPDRNQRRKNRKKWSQHNDYPNLRGFLTTTAAIKNESHIPTVDDVIAKLEELQNVCNQIFHTPAPNHALIIRELNEGEKNNDLSAFLQLSYTINFLFENLENYIENAQKDEKWLHKVRKLEDYKLFDFIFGLLRDGRHSTIHHMWRKDYQNLASVICLILSNLMPILLSLKSETSISADVNDANLTMWWYLLWIKYEVLVQNRGSSIEMKYLRPWILFYIIRAEEHVSDEECSNLLKMLREVTKELIAIYLSADEYDYKLEEFKNICQKYNLKRELLIIWPNNIIELSQQIESIFEEAIIGFRLIGVNHDINGIINYFGTFVKQQKSRIHLNRYGLAGRTPLMFSMSLCSDNMIDNEQLSTIIKKLVAVLIWNGADPDKYNSLTLHPMHYAALVGVKFKKYFQKYCNLKCPPDGVFGINSQQFYDNFRIFTYQLNGNEKDPQNSFFNPIAMADASHNSISTSYENSFLYLYNNYGQTPLTRAVESGNKVAVEVLVNASTEIDQKEIKEFKIGETVFNDTALLKAIKLKPIIINETTIKDREEIIKIILKKRADKKITDIEQKSSVDYAKYQWEKAEFRAENWFRFPERNEIDPKTLELQLKYAEKIYFCLAEEE